MAKQTDPEPGNVDGFRCISPAMQHVYEEIEACVRGGLGCLFLGPRGSGKEFLATYYYREFVKTPSSAQRDIPFRAINCACLVDTLAVSQLFGHVSGAFTGATKDSPGLFREAEGGVLFLDEIGDIPSNLSAILNRALEGEAMPVGSSRRYSTRSVRVIAATEQPQGTLRSSLHDRFQVFIAVPGLDERKEDIKQALQYFFEQAVARRRSTDGGLRAPLRPEYYCSSGAASIAENLEACVLHRSWPGNFRALRNLMDFAVMMAGGATEARFCEDVQSKFVLYLDRYSLSQAHGTGPKMSPATDTQGVIKDLTEKMARLFPGLRQGEKSRLAAFLSEQRGHFFTRDDLERESPRLSRSTLHDRLRRLRDAGIITQEGGRGELYQVTFEQPAPAAEVVPGAGFLPLALDVMWPQGARRDLATIRELLSKAQIVFVGGEAGVGKSVCVQALGTDLKHHRPVYYYPFGDRGVPWFLRIIRQELARRAIPAGRPLQEGVDGAMAMDAASLAEPVHHLFASDEHPLLILDNIELVSDPQQERAVAEILRCWGESISFLLVGTKLGGLLRSEISLPVVEYTILRQPVCPP